MAAIRTFAASSAGAIDETVRGIMLGAEPLKTVDAFDAFYRLAALTRQAEQQWQTMDVMLLPTTGTTYKIADVLADPVRLNSNLGIYTNFVNLMDLSALAVPAGFRSNGLPFGVTLIGRAFEDGMLAGLGDRLHRAMPDAKLGATDVALAGTPIAESAAASDVMQVAVVGAHLSGQPLNGQLTERNAASCAPAARRTATASTRWPTRTPPKPGLIFDGNGPGRIEVEIWEMSASAFGSFVTLIPSPLGIGT